MQVGCKALLTGIQGAFLNVQINLKDIKDQDYCSKVLQHLPLPHPTYCSQGTIIFKLVNILVTLLICIDCPPPQNIHKVVFNLVGTGGCKCFCTCALAKQFWPLHAQHHLFFIHEHAHICSFIILCQKTVSCHSLIKSP